MRWQQLEVRWGCEEAPAFLDTLPFLLPHTAKPHCWISEQKTKHPLKARLDKEVNRPPPRCCRSLPLGSLSNLPQVRVRPIGV